MTSTSSSQNYPDALKSLFGITGGGSLSSGAGFLDAELFSFMIPLLVLVLAIGTGARIFAGEEDAGRLELVLAYPLRRSRRGCRQGGCRHRRGGGRLRRGGRRDRRRRPDLRPRPRRSATWSPPSCGVALLGVFYGILALSAGAATGNKALAVGALGRLRRRCLPRVGPSLRVAGWLDPFRFLSPFWWIGTSPLQHGIRGAGVVVLLAASAVALAAGAALVERRDLEVP